MAKNKAVQPTAKTAQTQTDVTMQATAKSSDNKASTSSVAEQTEQIVQGNIDTTGADTPTNGAKRSEKSKQTQETVADTLVKIGRDALKRTPVLSIVYVTTDGTPFASLNDAENHGRTLKCKTVITVDKEVAE